MHVALLPVFLVLTRSWIRKALRYYRRSRSPRRALIIGSGDCLSSALDALHELDFASTAVIGILPAGTDAQIAQAREAAQTRGMPVLAVPLDWSEFFAANPCETVIIALPYEAYPFLGEHFDAVANQVADVKMLPDLTRFTGFRPSVEYLGGRVLAISAHGSPLEGSGFVFKRVLDTVGSVVAILLFSPLFVVLALAIRMTSRGPIFYKQVRMGIDGRTFSILKFRTMPIDAEAKTGEVWASKSDDRATGLGSVMRRLSLDELPQLFNVLSGEMSLVGPRPERPVFVNQFRRHVPGYMLRHKVKAGMTGWAQIHGWRGNTSIEKRIEYDLYYVRHWSLWLDLRILFLTVFRGFVHPNAY